MLRRKNEKMKKKKYVLLKEIFRNQHKNVFILLVFLMLSASISVLPAYFIGRIIDYSTKGITEKIYITFLFLVITILSCKLIDFVSQFISNFLSINIANRITQKMMKNVMYSDVDWLGGWERGEIIQTLLDDTEALKRISIKTIPQFIYIVVTAVVSAIMIYEIYPIVFLATLCAIPCYFISLGKNSKRQKVAEKNIRNIKAETREYLIESLENIKDIKIYGVKEEKKARFWNYQKKWSQNIKDKYIAINVFKSIPRVLSALSPAIVYIVAGVAVIRGDLSIGLLVSLVVLVPKLNEPIKAYANFYVEINNLDTLSERMIEYMNAPIDPSYSNMRKDKLCCTPIVFKNVCLARGQRTILSDLSFVIEEGKKIAIVGETGSGKSSILKMIVGLVKPTAGQIFLGLSDLNDLNCNQVREKIGVVLQDNYLFDEDVRENLSYLSEPSEERIVEICENLDIDYLLKRKETDLGENINTISGGENQRINIGRILLAEFPVLILDEPTSELNNLLQTKVMNYICNVYGKRKTIVYTAHKLETVSYADEVMFIQNGKIQALGTHSELLETCEEYFTYVKRNLKRVSDS